MLADEINRTTPKTQSSLLEAMNEAQVSLDHSTYPLPRPFMVLATQNPLEYEGTYPLPESQLDRFLLRIRIGYPDAADEKADAARHVAPAPDAPRARADGRRRAAAAGEPPSRCGPTTSVLDYLVALVTATRRSPLLALGVSPRGSLALLRAARARALAEGRDYLVPDDIKELAVPALAHRVIAKARARHGRQHGRRGRIRAILARRSRSAMRRGRRARGAGRAASSSGFRPRRTIWPTRDGWWCLFAAVGLGFAAINTGNNLLYLLVSLLLGLIIVSGILSEQVDARPAARPIVPEEIYAGRPAPSAPGDESQAAARLPLDHLEVPGRRRAPRSVPAAHRRRGPSVWSRGRRRCPRAAAIGWPGIRMTTRFPFGLFVKAAARPPRDEVIVFPASCPCAGPLRELAAGGPRRPPAGPRSRPLQPARLPGRRRPAPHPLADQRQDAEPDRARARGGDHARTCG